MVIGFNELIVILEFARRAGGQVVAGSAGGQAVTNVVYCRFAFGYRSVSFYGSINWNLARRAGGQVVRKKCVVVFALRRSVSF